LGDDLLNIGNDNEGGFYKWVVEVIDRGRPHS
jgi:hypothetical protein